jgi:RNA recognition motif-containing protein
MSTKLYVSNLPLSATAELLITRFRKFGDVVSVALEPVARANRRGAFVEMATIAAAHTAIAALNLSDLDGRLISVFLALEGAPKSAS